ncbi:MAG: bacillithiol biosynthesis deacetylase BshB1 [Saprospiraceae bacterium]
MKLDILAIGVHPDDVELSCSGTLLKQIALGNTVGILDLTRGELGSRGTVEIRDIEAQQAKIMMGALVRENLGLEDGFFSHSQENIRKIIKIIRKYQPSIVLANAIEDRHPDHGRAAKLTADACFLSGLVKIVTTDENGNKQIPWRPNYVYHYMQDRSLRPDFLIDISPFAEKKMELINVYSSQFYNPDSNEPDTPISNKNFLLSVQAKDKVFGRLLNVEYAEAFTAARTIGVRDLFDLI